MTISSELPTAKASFATKFVNPHLLDLDPRGRIRIRFSLMPEADSKLLDIRTSPIAERIAAIDDFVDAGYEVHLNLSPVVLRDGWERDWAQLLARLDDSLGAAFKQQAAAEIIMLTHNRELHEVNMNWHPNAEDVLWRPELQQAKRSQTGMWNVRYRNDRKREGLQKEAADPHRSARPVAARPVRLLIKRSGVDNGQDGPVDAPAPEW